MRWALIVCCILVATACALGADAINRTMDHVQVAPAWEPPAIVRWDLVLWCRFMVFVLGAGSTIGAIAGIFWPGISARSRKEDRALIGGQESDQGISTPPRHATTRSRS